MAAHVRTLLRASELPLEVLQETVAAVNPGWHPTDVHALAHDLAGADAGVITSLVADGSLSGPLLPRLADVAAPVLLLRADPQRGGLLGAEDFARARALLPPGNRAVDVAGAGHGLHRDAFELFVRALDDFAAVPPAPIRPRWERGPVAAESRRPPCPHAREERGPGGWSTGEILGAFPGAPGAARRCNGGAEHRTAEDTAPGGGHRERT